MDLAQTFEDSEAREIRGSRNRYHKGSSDSGKKFDTKSDNFKGHKRSESSSNSSYKKRDLKDVECRACKQKGHYSNSPTCPQFKKN